MRYGHADAVSDLDAHRTRRSGRDLALDDARRRAAADARPFRPDLDGFTDAAVDLRAGFARLAQAIRDGDPGHP